MIRSDVFYNNFNNRTADRFARGAQKKTSKAYGAELFGKEGEGQEEKLGKYGKQSVLDDAQATGKGQGAMPKTETESQIIVKPDGSRVLVITVRCGQSVKVKSLKLSDPTDMENEQGKEGVGGKTEGETVKTGDGREATVLADGSVQISAAYAANGGFLLTGGTE